MQVRETRSCFGPGVFIAVFFNAETMKTSFALIKQDQRIFGADNTRGWHLHPFGDTENHFTCGEISFESFLAQVETSREVWQRS